MDALQQLQHVDGMEDLERDLEIDLRRLQKASLKQMGSFEVDLGIGDSYERAVERFSKLNLSDALKQFALLDRSRDPDELRQVALKMRETSPLVSMLSAVHIDGEGRTASRSAGASFDQEPEETWFRRMIGQHESIHRATVISGAIDPARVTIQARFGIAERHFNAIVGLSEYCTERAKAHPCARVHAVFPGRLHVRDPPSHPSGGGRAPAPIEDGRSRPCEAP